MESNLTIDVPVDFRAPQDPGKTIVSREGIAHIQKVFSEMITQGLHPGAQLVALYRGQVVVDLAGGLGDLRRGRPVTPDMPFLVFSVTKAFTGVCIHKLVEQGQLELDTPIARFWPEFGCKGKEKATIRHALLHQAGIPLRGLLTQIRLWPDWDLVTKNVAGLPAEYPPGTKTAYHMVNYGFILGEVVRRVTGKPIDLYLKETFVDPLGLQDTVMRLLPAWQDRIAGLYSGHFQQHIPVYLFNRPRIRTALMPAATLHTTARDLAVFYQMLANGGQYGGKQYLLPETIARATALSYEGMDASMRVPMRWAMGFHLGGKLLEDGPSFGDASTVRTFGHAGQGSCIGWADPDRGLVMAFTCNRLLASVSTRLRWNRLANAVWEAVGSH